MAYDPWKKIDDGFEGVWAPDVWIGFIEIASRHEGDRVYDKDAAIYQELEERYPGTTWRSQDKGSFRPFFRDSTKPWTLPGLASFNETFQLTPRGHQLANGSLSARDLLATFFAEFTENDERPFCVLAYAFLNAGKPLSLVDLYYGVDVGFRPGSDDLNASLALAVGKSDASIPGTDGRRLKLMLSLMERSGAIAKGGSSGGPWRVWDWALLEKLAAGVSLPATDAEPKTDIAGIDAAFVESAKLAKLSLAPSLARNVIASLLAKQFLILTGLSGSGKTKIAHALAAWMSASPDQYRLIAVGADWTSNENIIGYPDALQSDRYCKPTSGALDVIIKASNDTSRPYFLILDEMNLSHVERYFSDILSAIESKQQIALHNSASDLKSGNNDTEVIPATITFPSNLFVIGTVNVDETTYMFSPKVLDRANVIEFRATSADINAFFNNPQPVKMDALAGQGASYASAFVSEATTSEASLSSLEAEICGGVDVTHELGSKLVQIFDGLAEIGGEFGFRTAFEISRFSYFHAFLTGPGWQLNDALDAQVLQKLLPKLHGSDRRLGPVLNKLGEFCVQNNCAASLLKIQRMQDRLKDGFTSFAEA